MKLVIFDIDGTLANTKQIDDACFIKAFDTTFQIDIRQQKWEDLTNLTDWSITEEIIQQQLKRNPTEAEYGLMETNMIHNLQTAKRENPAHFQEIPGAKSFFDYLQTLPNITLGIATGAWEKSALIKLNAIDISPINLPFSNSSHFKTREGITNHTIQQATAKYDGDFEEIIYFGDGVWDFKTCRNLGIRFIGIDVLRDGKLRDIGAKTVFRDYRDKDKILQNIGA